MKKDLFYRAVITENSIGIVNNVISGSQLTNYSKSEIDNLIKEGYVIEVRCRKCNMIYDYSLGRCPDEYCKAKTKIQFDVKRGEIK